MRVIVCLDDRLGLAFNRRRQSRDRKVTEDILALTEGGKLYVTPYTAKLFEGCNRSLCLSERPLWDTPSDGWCFVELESPRDRLKDAKMLVIYRWNRHYPSDIVLEDTPESLGFTLKESREFEGFSHEKITREIYER